MSKLSLFVGLLPQIKKWIFPDGSFKEKRAAMLIIFFILILIAIQVFGFDTVTMSIKLLDEVSDIIGYSD